MWRKWLALWLLWSGLPTAPACCGVPNDRCCSQTGLSDQCVLPCTGVGTPHPSCTGPTVAIQTNQDCNPDQYCHSTSALSDKCSSATCSSTSDGTCVDRHEDGEWVAPDPSNLAARMCKSGRVHQYTSVGSCTLPGNYIGWCGDRVDQPDGAPCIKDSDCSSVQYCDCGALGICADFANNNCPGCKGLCNTKCGDPCANPCVVSGSACGQCKRMPVPTKNPTVGPTTPPSPRPTASPMPAPTRGPSTPPSRSPTAPPSLPPSSSPTTSPEHPSPSVSPTDAPTTPPQPLPTGSPSRPPSSAPSAPPQRPPTLSPSRPPQRAPTRGPSAGPRLGPTVGPSIPPTRSPSLPPAPAPTAGPDRSPSRSPSAGPTRSPTLPPSGSPSRGPQLSPTRPPSVGPTPNPSAPPSAPPSAAPSICPTCIPTRQPTKQPSASPAASPTVPPSAPPTTPPPSTGPSLAPSSAPRLHPPPTLRPTAFPTGRPAAVPTVPPTRGPSVGPRTPTLPPSTPPSWSPSQVPSSAPTMSPTPAPPPFMTEQDTASGVVAVGGAAGGGGAAAATLAVLADDQCGADGDDHSDDVPVTLHPLRFALAGSMRAGAVAGNSLLILLLAASHACIAAVVDAVLPAQEKSTKEGIKGGGQARLRFPSLSLVLGTILYAGTSHSAAWLLMRASDVGVAPLLIGVFGVVAVTLGAPLALYGLVLRHVSTRAVYQPEEPPATGCRRWLQGEGDWVSASVAGPHSMWFERWGGVFRPFSPRWPAMGPLWKLIEAAIVSILQAAPRYSCGTCAAVDAVTAAALFGSTGVTVWMRPHARPRDDVAFPLLDFLQGVALSIRAAGQCGGGTGLRKAVAIVLLIATGVLLVKAALDIMCALHAVKTDRHDVLFLLYLDRKALLRNESGIDEDDDSSLASMPRRSPVRSISRASNDAPNQDIGIGKRASLLTTPLFDTTSSGAEFEQQSKALRRARRSTPITLVVKSLENPGGSEPSWGTHITATPTPGLRVRGSPPPSPPITALRAPDAAVGSPLRPRRSGQRSQHTTVSVRLPARRQSSKPPPDSEQGTAGGGGENVLELV